MRNGVVDRYWRQYKGPGGNRRIIILMLILIKLMMIIIIMIMIIMEIVEGSRVVAL